MTALKTILAGGFLAATTAFTTVAIAQDGRPPAAAMRAIDVAMARISQDLSHEEIGVLNLVAHAAAAAGLCADIGLDEGAVYGALTDATHDATAGDTEEDAMVHRDFGLIAFGILAGIMLQQGAEDEAQFCADAIELAKDPAAGRFISIVSTPVLYDAKPK